ncbi:MAG: hypothetical protein KDD62_03450, partial [Bdellovibrionales bacterium]|nr:hypothetical protein [Bdellovibrionales bacterium]
MNSDTNKDADFDAQLEQTLLETELQVKSIEQVAGAPSVEQTWSAARRFVEEFKPVPFFIWRLSNFVLGQPGKINQLSEGLVFGMKKIVLAAARDEFLGSGRIINKVRDALYIVPSDIIAAVTVMHAICRRLGSKPFERIWGPILDDAILRALVGCMIGEQDPSFGPGRGMLAGFSSRCGLCILIAQSDLSKAKSSLELLATGEDIRSVGMKLFGCDPLQVSAMILSASGCGRDAAHGIACYSAKYPIAVTSDNKIQRQWLSAYSICEELRRSNAEAILDEYWEALGFEEESDRKDIVRSAKKAVREGHTWD